MPDYPAEGKFNENVSTSFHKPFLGDEKVLSWIQQFFLLLSIPSNHTSIIHPNLLKYLWNE